jgi:hypothetical protein
MSFVQPPNCSTYKNTNLFQLAFIELFACSGLTFGGTLFLVGFDCRRRALNVGATIDRTIGTFAPLTFSEFVNKQQTNKQTNNNITIID